MEFTDGSVVQNPGQVARSVWKDALKLEKPKVALHGMEVAVVTLQKDSFPKTCHESLPRCLEKVPLLTQAPFGFP